MSEKEREIDLAHRLMNILKARRAKNKKDWQRIGYALYYVSYTSFPVFKAFSEKNKKGFDITSQDIWRDAPKYCKNYSIDTLRRWAFLDNEDKYYDILHLTVPVEKDIGALKFGEEDIMDAEAFSKLLEICNAKLVIFAVCDSLTAGARIARKTNIIVAIDTIGDEMVQEWERTFYKLFSRGHSLSRAYDIARTTTSTQMVLLMKNDLTIISE